jgi:hypothetical protein
MEILGVVQGIDYLERNLRRFMRPTRRGQRMPTRPRAVLRELQKNLSKRPK